MAGSVFATSRRVIYVTLFALAAVGLGIAANLTNLFLNTHHDFLIYSLVPPSFMILMILGLLMKSRPPIDLVLLFIADILWLALGAYSADVIGFVQCDTLGGQTIVTSIGGAYSSQSYCYQMKTIEAIAWAEFGLITITFWVILAVTLAAVTQGKNAFEMDIDDLEWVLTPQGGGQYGYTGVPGGQPYTYGAYGNYPQYYANGSSGGAGGGGTIAQGQYYGQPVVVQQPGRNILVSHGPNGPQVQELPAGEGVGVAQVGSGRSRRASEGHR